MIEFSANVVNLLKQNAIEIFYLLLIKGYITKKEKNGDFTTFTYYDLLLTTYYHDVDIPGLGKYRASGEIMVDGVLDGGFRQLAAIAPPKQESVVDKASFEIALIEPSFYSASNIEPYLVGNTMELRAGFVDLSTNKPLLTEGDTFLVYKGYVNSFSYKTSTKELGENVLNIIGSSSMVNLDHRRQFYLNRDFVRSKYPDDSCCDQISENSLNLALKWGKV